MPKDGTLTIAPPAANLALWEKLKRTNPTATKPFTRSSGFKGTQIDPTWRLQMMTEAFGPVGKGWGYEQMEWTISERMVFICCRVWYRDPETGEQCWTGPQWGGTELFRRKRDGTQEPTDEAFKMSITDAIGKCCLQLGLAADIYMGQFDDSKYREESEAIFAAKSDPALSPEAIAAFDAETKEKVAGSADVDALDALWRGGVSAKLREVGKVDKAAQHRIVAYFSQRKAELLGAAAKPQGGGAVPSVFWQRASFTIPVPKFDDGGYDWPTWAGKIRKAAETAPDAVTRAKLRQNNAANLAGLKEIAPGEFDRISALLDGKAETNAMMA